MKKVYENPSVELVKFQYRDQVVVASGCKEVYVNTMPDGRGCQEDLTKVEYTQNV